MKNSKHLINIFLISIFFIHKSCAYNDTIMFHDSIYNVPYSTTIYDNALANPTQFDDAMNGQDDDLDVEMSSLNQKTNVRKKNYLIQAVQDNRYQKVEYLLQREHYDVNSQDKDGRTALHYAAAYDNQPIAQLLLQYGAIVDKADHDGWTALHVAADKNAYNVAQLLIDHKADCNSDNLDGMKPFDYCHNPMMQAIVRHS